MVFKYHTVSKYYKNNRRYSILVEIYNCSRSFSKEIMRSKRLLYTLLLITCFTAHTVFCQPIENNFTHYTTKDGFAGGAVRCITEDSSGFLWLGCDNGLSRFDGYTFKVYCYSPLDTNSLRENNICNLFIDSKKRLWIVSYNWLYLYHPDGDWLEHFSINEFTKDNINHIVAEENGQLIITGNKALYKFSIQQKKFSIFYHNGIPSQIFIDYKKDKEGIEWIGTKNGLYRYDPKTNQSTILNIASLCTRHIDNWIANLNLLPNDYLLATTYSLGLFLFDRKTKTAKRFLPDTHITCLYKLNDSTFLVCTEESGISVFNLHTETITSTIAPDKLNPASLLENDKIIFSVFCDREGIIWLGGVNVEKYDFKDYDIKIMPANSNEHHIKLFDTLINLYKCADGNFLLGSYFGIRLYNPSTSELKTIDDKRLNNKIVSNFREDGHGQMWCTISSFQNTYPQICAFSVKNNKVNDLQQYDVPSFEPSNDLKFDTKGHVLIATPDKGLIVFDTANKTTISFDADSKPPSQLTSSSCNIIYEDHNGCIWIGTKKGINKLQKDGITVKQYSRNKKNSDLEPDWKVFDITEDKHGIIWFATYQHGIGRINPLNDSVSFFSIAQGLPTCYFYKLCIDEQDNLWAASRMGIVNLNVVTLQNKLYTEDEGFPLPHDIIDIHYSQYTKKLYILTHYSIFEINAKNADHNYNIPKTTITGFSVFDKEQPLSARSDISLKYNENFISIEFAALLFHSNKQIKYAYKMDGVDENWVYCNYKRNASYTNLSPGHYTFRVKSQSPQGVWNEPTGLFIIIKPPYWQTWWFYLLEALSVVASMLWINRLYTERKLAKQTTEIAKLQAVSTERARIASDMHDELGAGLTSIRMLSEIAAEKIDRDITVKPEIEKIERSATTLSENLREIIWTMNTRFDKLEDFIVYIRTYAVEYFDDSPISFQFHSPDSIPQITLSGELRRNIFLCIKEALNNIVKHSGATEASLTFNVIGNILHTEINDNGTGINTTQINKFGNGMNIMKERLKKFGGYLEIDTTIGTKLIFKINIFVP